MSSFPKLARMLLLAFVAHAASAAALGSPPAVEHFFKRDAFFNIKISPDGRHLAAVVPAEEGSALIVMDPKALKLTAQFYAGRNHEIDDFWWSSDERVLMAIAQRFSGHEAPIPTGEIFAINADGTGSLALAGYRASDGREGSFVRQRESEGVAVTPIDLLPGESREALVEVLPFGSRGEGYASVERMNTSNGRRIKLTQSPVIRAQFLTDPSGRLRFAQGVNVRNFNELHYREPEGEGWRLLNDQEASGEIVTVLGFSPDGDTAYLQVSRAEGPDAVERLNPVSGERSEVFRHARKDPSGVIRTFDGTAVLGVYVRDPQRVSHFFEPEHPEVKLLQTFAATFQGHDVTVTSSTLDGGQMVLFVFSDQNPGEYFLVDRDTREAKHLGSRGSQLDPESMGRTRAIRFQARDDLEIEGLLTLPPGGSETGLPMVLLVHGGPFDVEDRWGFQPQVQLLATRGYAVLQVNFRGSSGRGSSFVRAGYRQWGQAMQDDLTDATRWAIENGIADAGRICIFGSSYGGYASLMGVAREPDLYACAIGEVGVYDLELMFKRGDVSDRKSGRNYLKTTLGEERLKELSPTTLASQIRVPVLLAAGEADRRAPVLHTKRMERALKQAGVSVESLYFKGEAHGFYSIENNIKFQQALLAFLDRQIGAGRDAARAPALAE
jgi:dipeptidyl aminopeptidase/acylaminoacyl peptidase